MVDGRAYKEGHNGHMMGANGGLHRVVYEKAYGKIPDGFEIHHIDLDPKNNSIDNLVVLTPLAHRRLHAALRKVRRECAVCGDGFNADSSLKRDCCSKSCYEKLHRADSRVCSICGVGYEVRKSSTGKTCSVACSRVLARATIDSKCEEKTKIK